MRILSAVFRMRVWLGLSVVLLAAAAVLAVPQLRWRAHVLVLHATGSIPDLAFRDLVTYMLPGAEQSMKRLIDTRNPYAVIQNVRQSPGDIAAGRALYDEQCASCHGTGGTGGSSAPAFVDHHYVRGESDWAVYRNIRHGIPGTGMPAFPALSETQRWQLVSYVRSVGSSDAAPATAGHSPAHAVKVTAAELAEAREPADDWLTYSGSLLGTRHSALTQIHPGNVDRLQVRWIRQFEGDPVIEASPLIRDGVMYLSVPPCSVRALDAATGSELWAHNCRLLSQQAGEHTGAISRGVALLNDRIYLATWDDRMIALDAGTGERVWEATVSDDYETYFISGAPLAYGDLVVTGVGTRQVGRGFIVAFDADTGEERWRFMAIPGPGDPGHDTWAGESWKVGGAPTWLTGSYDAEEDLLFWGVGNPKPDYDKEARRGDNLYTNSVVALRGSTGELVWHFQFTPGDDHDWDSAQVPVLAEDTASGTPAKRLLWANRNGFYYVLDRLTGQFLHGSPFVHTTWNSGLDENGRPILVSRDDVGNEGELVYPGNVGGTNWWSPSFDPKRQLMIVPTLEQGMVFFPSMLSWPKSTGRPFYTAVRALDAFTGELAWEHRRPPRRVDNRMGGLLTVEGGLVFGSDRASFFALHADTGELLWSLETGGNIVAAPVTFAVDGRQHVTIAAGRDLITLALPSSVLEDGPATLTAEASP